MRVCVTGGSGYVGSALVPALIESGHQVTVLDAMLFGNVLQPHPALDVIEGDIRALPASLRGRSFDALIHLACIANDPSWALDPAWGKAVNYDALAPLFAWAKDAGVQRLIYASSSSVYGTKPDGVDVTEDLECLPLTDYSKYKLLGELVALESGIPAIVLRPATVCGYAPRLRLDVVVNQMTIDALTKRIITVHSRDLYRAHLHISDMVRAYVHALDGPADLLGRIFNVGGENLRIGALAEKVQALAGGEIHDVGTTNDPRSYTLNSDSFIRAGFQRRFSVDEAIASVVKAYTDGRIPEPQSTRYHNIRRMEELVACRTS